MKYLFTLAFTSFVFFNCFSQTQNKDLVDHIHKVLNNCNYYEVTEDMFELISKDERYQNEPQIEYLKKIKYLIYVECEDDKSNFYDDFTAGYTLNGFKILMRSKSTDERFTFYRSTKNGLNEYLLIHSGGLSYIITSLNISTLDELSGIMNFVGELGNG